MRAISHVLEILLKARLCLFVGETRTYSRVSPIKESKMPGSSSSRQLNEISLEGENEWK